MSECSRPRESHIFKDHYRQRELAFRATRFIMAQLSAVHLERLQVYGLEKYPIDRPTLLVGSHHSQWDSVYLGLMCHKADPERSTRAIGKREMWKYGMGPLFEAIGVIPVDRKRPDVRHLLRTSGEIFENGQSIFMFGAGERTTEKRLARAGKPADDLYEMPEFHGGAAMLALTHNVEVIPVGIYGSHALTQWRPAPVTMAVGEPIDPNAFRSDGASSREHRHALTEAIRGDVQALYDFARAKQEDVSYFE